MEAYLRDVRYAARMLWRNPGFTAVVVLCLALGIGANTAVFSAAYAVVLRQLPFPHADALVEIRRSRLQPNLLDSKFLSIPATDDIMAQSKQLALIGRYLPANLTLIGGTAPEQLSGLYVTPEWFEALGVQPQLGRRVEPGDLAPGKDAVVVLSYAIWQRDFGGRTDAIGASVLVAAQPMYAFYPFAPPGTHFTIIGVMPPKRQFPVDGDVWMPLWLIAAIRGIAPATIPRIEEVGVDSTLLMYTLLVCAATGLAVGILPAVKITDHPLALTMNTQGNGRRIGFANRLRLRAVLIAFEIALAFPIAVGAALTVQSLRNIVRIHLGYDTEDVVTANVKLSSTTCAQFDRCITSMESILNNVRALPGVRATSFVSSRPLDTPLGAQVTTAVNWDPKHAADAVTAEFQLVTPEYFKTLGIPLLSGRSLDLSDRKGAPLVAVVNQSLARALFGSSDAVGRSFSLAPMGRNARIDIVGEVSDIRDISLTKAPRPAFYVPYTQSNFIARTILLVKTRDAMGTLAPALVAQVHHVDPDAPVTAVEGLDQTIAQQRAESRFEAIVLASFAMLGVLLTVFGIHGLVSYATSERLREFGIRLALGARPRDIFRLIAREGIATTMWGLTFGIAAAVAFSHYLRSQLYEISPTDPSVFIGMALTIALAAFVGYCVPALRATTVDPLTVLRHD